MYFDDTLGNDMIVLCKPELPEHIILDDNNNLYYNLLVCFEKEMIISEYYLSIEIGKHSFKIPVSKLYMKQEQTYVLKGQGIPKIVEDDVYNVSCKADIIITICFK